MKELKLNKLIKDLNVIPHHLLDMCEVYFKVHGEHSVEELEYDSVCQALGDGRLLIEISLRKRKPKELEPGLLQIKEINLIPNLQQIVSFLKTLDIGELEALRSVAFDLIYTKQKEAKEKLQGLL